MSEPTTTYSSVNEIHDKLPEIVDRMTIGNTSDTVILPLTELKATTTLAVDASYESRTVELTDSTGFAAGQCLRIIDPTIDRYYCGRIVSMLANNVTIDTPLDANYTSGAQVITANGNMAVDGSVTPVTFKLRHGDPSVSKKFHITRIIFNCITAGAVDLNKFADQTVLTNGLMLRTVNGHTKNNFTLKSNLDIAGLAYDFDVYTASNPSQGVNGFACRFTFLNLETRLDVETDGNIEVIVQDDLTGITTFRITAEGHEVDL